MTHESLVTGSPRPDRATNYSLGAAFVALVNAILQTLIAFGLDLTAEQSAAIGVVVNAFLIFGIALTHVYLSITAERERWTHLNGPEG